MSSSNPAFENSNLAIGNQLLDISLSPLSRPPGYSGSCPASCPEGSSEDHPASYPEGNSESYLGRYKVSYSAGYPERNSEGGPEGSRDRCSADCSTDCPDNRSEGSPESNLPSNGESSLLSSSENSSAGSLPGSDFRHFVRVGFCPGLGVDDRQARACARSLDKLGRRLSISAHKLMHRIRFSSAPAMAVLAAPIRLPAGACFVLLEAGTEHGATRVVLQH